MQNETKTRERRDVELPEPVNSGQLVHVDTSTGEQTVIPSHTHNLSDTPLSLRDATFERVGTVPVTTDEDGILRKAVDRGTEIDVLPTGEVYMSHVFVRRRLNDAFKPMGWCLRPLSAVAVDPHTQVMYREYALVVKGVVVATAFGSTKYQPHNERMDYADAAESVRSNALTRCAKDLGIGSECWDPRFCQKWIDEFAVHVWTGYKKSGSNETRVDAFWRRVDMKPLRGEFAIMADSPNQRHAKIKGLKYDTADSFQTARALLDGILYERAKAAGATRAERSAPVSGGESTQSRGTATKKDDQKPATDTDTFFRDAVTLPTARAGSPYAAHLVKDCRILKRGTHRDNSPFTLHLIVMLDGTEYTTFSETVYKRAMNAQATRALVEIDYEEVDVAGKRRKQIQDQKFFTLYRPKPGEVVR